MVVLFKRRGVQGRVSKNGWPICGRKRQSMIITALETADARTIIIIKAMDRETLSLH